MTKEDAMLHMILRREELKHSVGDLDEDIKAFDMAIEALEYNPCDKYIEEIDHLRKYIVKLETQIVEQEPCEDAISRKAAIEAVRVGSLSTATLYGRTEEGETARKEIERSIKALPSVSTEKLDKAKSEIRCGENKAYNADFTMGCEYAISVIERMFEEVEE